jgi:hypothetical protein
MKQEEAEEEHLQFSYGNLSDDVIKERLFQTMNNNIPVQHKIKEWLEKDHVLLVFIRQHASLLAQYSSLKMKVELYQSYTHMTQPVLDWLSGMSKNSIKCNNINENFFKIQTYINKQLKNSEEQFRNIREKLAQSKQYQSPMTTASEIDLRLITSGILLFVRQDQQRFNIEYIKKRYLLMLNVKDVRLVQEFYHLKPNIRQVIGFCSTFNKSSSFFYQTYITIKINQYHSSYI